jgi:ketosteroid isomerase-like protein
MAHPNEDLVREGFAAFGRGDMDVLRKRFFADDVRWHVSGRSSLAGDYEGPEQVIQYFGRVFELTGGTFSIELHDVLANDEHAAALITIHGERAGKQLNDNTVLERSPSCPSPCQPAVGNGLGACRQLDSPVDATKFTNRDSRHRTRTADLASISAGWHVRRDRTRMGDLRVVRYSGRAAGPRGGAGLGLLHAAACRRRLTDYLHLRPDVGNGMAAER